MSAPSVLEILERGVPDGWNDLFRVARKELELTSRILADKGSYYPLPEHVFRAYELTRPENIKVVIIGQDPYPGTLSSGLPEARGLAFSGAPGERVPASLRNIIKELKRTYTDFPSPTDGDLTGWSRQGVFLLNKSLTVKPGDAGSHLGIWDGFLTRTINHIKQVNPEAIFVLWGAKAQELTRLIQPNPILRSAHPSGLASRAKDPFVGNNHFAQINELLVSQGRDPIDWRF